jgi:hypothetical protein
MNDPMSRLEVCQREIDRVFGANYSTDHPELVAAVLTCATIDQAAAVIAAALMEEEDSGRPEVILPRRELVRP